MTKKIEVKIVKETLKAKLVEDSQGRQGWVQNRSFKNGLVNLKTFEKSVCFMRDIIKSEPNVPEFTSFHKDSVILETEKAYKYKVTVTRISNDKDSSISFFIPKSLVKINEKFHNVKSWVLEKKFQEILSGDYQICTTADNMYFMNNRLDLDTFEN